MSWQNLQVGRVAEGDAGLPARTVTLLLADVEGPTRLWQERGPELAAAFDALDAAVDAAALAHHGARPAEQGEGDSFVLAFTKATDALACALAIQHALAEGPLRVRMAVHTGDVQLRDGNRYLGTTLNRCARIRNAGHGGQILTSEATRDLILDGLPEGAWLVDLGYHSFRDLPRPEHVYQLVHRDLAQALPPLPSLDVVRHNLPEQLTSFVGRERELAAVQTALQANRLVTLTGAGGCGKTRLGIEVAARVAGEYHDGAWWVDLAPVTDADLVVSRVMSALRLKEVSGHEQLATLAAFLADKQLLLLLDNCEHLITACTNLAHALLLACPHLTVLAGSREPLGVSGELVWRVPSLSLPEERADMDAGAIAGYDATRLFVERATRARPNFAVDDSSVSTVSAICRRLDGIPLAIELAAARARMMTVDQILAALDDRFRVLTGGARTALPRQQTLLASVDWSYALLNGDEQALLRRLSVAAGGFTLDAAESIVVGNGLDELAVFDLLTNLVDKSLVIVDDDGRDTRCRLLETIRQYAQQKLAESGEAESIRDQHLAYFVGQATGLAEELEGRNYVAGLERARADLDNYRAACEWSLTTGRAEPAARCISALTKLWESGGHWQEGRAWIDRLMPLAAEIPDEVHADLCYAALSTSYQGGRIAECIAYGRQAIAVADAAGYERISARARSGVGYSHVVMGEGDLAREYLEEALDRGRRIADPLTVAESLAFLGMIDFGAGDIRGARRLYEESLAEARRLGYGPFIPLMASALASFAAMQGDLVVVANLAEPAVAQAERTNDHYALAVGLSALGAVACAQGRHAEAAASLQDVLDKARTADNLMGVTLSGTYLISAMAALSRFDEIPPLLEEVEAAAAVIGWSGVVSMTAATHAEMLIAAGRQDEGVAVLERARDHARSWTPAQPSILLADAWLAGSRQDRAGAEAALHAALAGAHDLAMHLQLIDSLQGLGGVAVERGATADGVRVLAAADTLRRRRGATSLPHREQLARAHLEKAREAVGTTSVEAAWADGVNMSADEAVSYATRGRGERKRPALGWDSLTPAETKVVGLVAAGMSNPEIASRLFISRRTVSTHLSHVFDKLGVRSRAELAATAARRAPSDS